MRTTIRIEDDLIKQAKREASRRGETLSALIEKSLRRALSGLPPNKRRRIGLPVSSARGGRLPGVDLNDTAALIDIMEGRP
jgi:hypothetical protein